MKDSFFSIYNRGWNLGAAANLARLFVEKARSADSSVQCYRNQRCVCCDDLVRSLGITSRGYCPVTGQRQRFVGFHLSRSLLRFVLFANRVVPVTTTQQLRRRPFFEIWSMLARVPLFHGTLRAPPTETTGSSYYPVEKHVVF